MVLHGEMKRALQDAFWFGHMASRRPNDAHDTAKAERDRVLREMEQRVGDLVLRAYLVGSACTFVVVAGLALLARSLRTGVW
jgi:glutathione S-transferase